MEMQYQVMVSLWRGYVLKRGIAKPRLVLLLISLETLMLPPVIAATLHPLQQCTLFPLSSYQHFLSSHVLKSQL